MLIPRTIALLMRVSKVMLARVLKIYSPEKVHHEGLTPEILARSSESLPFGSLRFRRCRLYLEVYRRFVQVQLQVSLRAATGGLTLLVETQVRQDAIVLHGFADAAEREAFRALIEVKTVGPQKALVVLSGLAAPDLAAEANAWNPDRWVLVADDGLVLTRADRARGTLPRGVRLLSAAAATSQKAAEEISPGTVKSQDSGIWPPGMVILLPSVRMETRKLVSMRSVWSLVVDGWITVVIPSANMPARSTALFTWAEATGIS
jgi:hypothetical protein